MDSRVAKVLLVDDHTLYRECLRGLFDRWDDFEIAGEASNGLEAVDFCRKHKPDLVLMDVSMPVMSGIDATKVIVEELPEIAIVMLTASLDEDFLIEAVRSGARGYILKNIHGYQLHHRLQDALRGETVLSSEVTTMCLDIVKTRQMPRGTKPETEKLLEQLNEQERKILYYVAYGESNKEIGARLYIGESTVKKRLSAILVKLGLENRVQAAVFAINSGLAE